MNALVCWNCGESLADLPLPVSRQASCPKCFNDLHCCRLCTHFDKHTNMACFEERADTPLEKENANFCEFFTPQLDAFQSSMAQRGNASRNKLDTLFAQSDPTESVTNDANIANETASGKPAPGEPTQLSEQELAKKKLDDLFS